MSEPASEPENTGRDYVLGPVGWVESSLVDRGMAPKQGDEGAPDAWLVFHPRFARAMRELAAGQEVLVLTWLDRADRDVLAVHPRGDSTRAETGDWSASPRFECWSGPSACARMARGEWLRCFTFP